MQTPQSITIIGRKWFQRSGGNTYNTAQILVNGKTVHRTAKQYGYDDHYVQVAAEWLENNGHIPKRDNSNGHIAAWRYIRDDLGITFEAIGIHVETERGL